MMNFAIATSRGVTQPDTYPKPTRDIAACCLRPKAGLPAMNHYPNSRAGFQQFNRERKMTPIYGPYNPQSRTELAWERSGLLIIMGRIL